MNTAFTKTAMAIMKVVLILVLCLFCLGVDTKKTASAQTTIIQIYLNYKYREIIQDTNCRTINFIDNNIIFTSTDCSPGFEREFIFTIK
ncbi:MAG: hypothetical protein HY606_05945 [Planctomycetes bacterium]|nr:hypothetical protein [Planctomycetota bacterium]